MKLTVLVDNNTLIDRNYVGEPGLSHLIGNLEALVHKKDENKIMLITHPLALCPKIHEGEPIGFIHSGEVLNRCFNVNLSKSPVWISEKLVYLGQIERTNGFENKEPLGITIVNNIEKEDYLLDDSALVYKSKKGLVIITGCSHSGICNIIDYAKKICRENRVFDIIGGFHLLNPSEEQIENTLKYLEELQPNEVHTCHCTDLYSKIALSQVVKLKEVGVSLTLEFE